MYLKKFIISIFILFTVFTYAQPTDGNKEIVRIGTCEDGNKQAIKDFKAGTYEVISFGMAIKIPEKLDFDNFYNTYMKSKYGITFRNGGCVIQPETECYANTMKELILEKFGDDIFEKSKAEAQKLYENAQ